LSECKIFCYSSLTPYYCRKLLLASWATWHVLQVSVKVWQAVSFWCRFVN